MSNAFAIYRLPHAQQPVLIEGEVQTLSALSDLNGRQGFVIAPFVATKETPILLVEGEGRVGLGESCMGFGEWCMVSGEGRIDSVAELSSTHHSPESTHQNPLTTPQYSESFATFHHALTEGRFQKLVLARCATEPNDGSVAPITLFQRACQCYPRMLIALVSTPQSGTWLTATPEVLLEDLPQHGLMRTIALAGTMRLHEDELDGEGLHLRWSTKNIQEQRYVASYIADVLKSLDIDYQEEGPRTVRAANLVHLCSDFTFRFPHHSSCIGDLLESLHPTPAVCGLPKKEAEEFILNHEPAPRRYYSGFMGPLTSHPSSLTTHLYVSLRCMQIEDSGYRLYAGGGLLRDSVCEKEWRETEAKMETMRQIMVN